MEEPGTLLGYEVSAPIVTRRMQKPLVVLLLLASGSLGQQMAGKTTSGHTYTCKALPAGRIVKRVSPAVPPEVTAKALAEGVAVELTIDKEGVPKEIKTTKGDPALAKAVADALLQWRWKPYRFNGEAVEVESNIYIRFEPSKD